MADDLHTLVVGRDAMACRFEVVFNAGELPGDTELGIAALDVVDEIEDRISIYRDTSEWSRLNAKAATEWLEASPDTFALLERARDLHARTHGAFDIAAGALVRAWGFLQRQGRVPNDSERAIALEASGTRWLDLDPNRRTVRFLRPGLELNPGAIGKGWALDQAADVVVRGGAGSFLLHGGQSSVLARGTQGPAADGRHGWRVGLRHPLRPGRRLATLILDDASLATSGSGTQFFIDKGRRLGHLLDPRTGLPAEGVLSATVITPSAADADALATALYVLGPAGLPLVAPPAGDTAAVLVLPEGSGGVRLLLANLAEAAIDIEPEPGLSVEWIRPPKNTEPP